MDIGTKNVSKYISAAFLVVLTLVACQSGDDAQNVLEESNLMFRMEDGKFAEHWGVGLTLPF